MNIEANSIWMTRNGDKAQINSVGVLVCNGVLNGKREIWHLDGHYMNNGSPHRWDLMTEVKTLGKKEAATA